MKAIAHHAVITSIRSKTDRSISYTVSSPELSSQEKSLFFELQNLNVNITIEPLGEEAPIQKIDKEVNQKSPSQRLYAVFFLLWKQNKPEEDFETYYRNQMEIIIDHFKEKLV